MNEKSVVTFGEIMLRLSPPGTLRFTQTDRLDLQFGGGESNVAVSLAQFGLPAVFITRLPENDLGDACLNFVRKYGVDTRYISRGGKRIGIYFLEHGAVQRGSKVIYDRAGSSFAEIKPGMVDWDAVFDGAGWFHWTGITPAISQGAAETCMEAIRAARRNGLTVSVDLNYRAKLWKWGKNAGEVMEEMVSLCQVAIGNEEDAEKVFGIHADGVNVKSGNVVGESYRDVCRKLAGRFPSLHTIAVTLRGSKSASHNTWSAVLWRSDDFYTGQLYDITHIVDRVGGGDSFVAGLIYGLTRYPKEPQIALDFAVAASALKHTIFGDFNLVTCDEVIKLMEGDASGRVSR